MKSKGFTLIELLTVIAVLGLILLIAMPIIGRVLDSSRNKVYEDQLSYILKAMENHVVKDDVTFEDGIYELTLKDLSDKGYIQLPIKDPRDKKGNFSENLCLVATRSETDLITYDSKDSCGATKTIIDVAVNNITNRTMDIEATIVISVSGIKEYYYSKDDGATWSAKQTTNKYKFSGLNKNTLYKIRVKVIDNDNNETISEVKEVRTTNEVVTITITGVAVNNKTSSSMSVVATGSPAEDIKGYYFSKDNGSTWTAMQTTNTYTYTGLTSGTSYPIKVKVVSFDNIESVSNTINASTTSINPPTVAISPTTLTAGNVTVTVTCPTLASGWTCEYQQNEGTWTSVSGTTKAITFSENGTLIARVKDSAGNVSTSALAEVTNIDKTPPTITGVVKSTTTSSSIKVVAQATSTSNVSGYSFSKDNGATWSAKQTTNTYTFTGLTSGTTYPIKVKVENVLGVSATSSTYSMATSSITAPTVAISPTTPTAGNVTVTVTCPTLASGWTCEYQQNGGSFTTITGTTKEVTFSANGTLIARVKDSAGNVSASALAEVTNIDKTPPTITGVVKGTTTSSSIAVIGHATATSNITGYYFSKDNGATWTGIQSTNIYTFTGLTSETTYPMKVRAVNALGVSVESGMYSMTTSAMSVAPTGSFTPTGWTNGNVTVTITCPTLATNWTCEYTTNVGVTWMPISGTTPLVYGSNVTLIARVRDDAGNVSGSYTAEVTNIDKVNPTVTVNAPTTTRTQTTIPVSVSASDVTGISGYQYYLNGSLKATTMSTSYTYTGLTAENTYSVMVRVWDNAGNYTDVTQSIPTAPTVVDIGENCYEDPGMSSNGVQNPYINYNEGDDYVTFSADGHGVEIYYNVNYSPLGPWELYNEGDQVFPYRWDQIYVRAFVNGLPSDVVTCYIFYR